MASNPARSDPLQVSKASSSKFREEFRQRQRRDAIRHLVAKKKPLEPEIEDDETSEWTLPPVTPFGPASRETLLVEQESSTNSASNDLIETKAILAHEEECDTCSEPADKDQGQDPEFERKLCHTCSGINFGKVVGSEVSKDTEYALDTLLQICTRPENECLFCDLISESIEEQLHYQDISIIDYCAKLARSKPLLCSLSPTWYASSLQSTSNKTSTRFYRLKFESLGLSNYGPRIWDLDFDVVLHDVEMNPSTPSRRLPTPYVDLELLRAWYFTCRREHTMQSHLDGRSPHHNGRFRLIDVVDLSVYVMDRSVSYMALSYVVGGCRQATAQDLYIQNARYDVPGGSIGRLKLESLSHTIQDAISLVSYFGERYLWVDAISIKEDPEDKKFLLPLMGEIYSGASLTIVAAAGTDADAGLAGFGARSRPTSAYYTFHTDLGMATFIRSQSGISSILSSTRWSRRGWTYQEHVLSARCLFFTDEEAFFSCPHMTDTQEWREAYTFEHVNRIRYTSHTSSLYGDLRAKWDINIGYATDALTNNFDMYTRLVEGYTQRLLTHQSDIINAFQGMQRTIWSDPKDQAFSDRFGLPAQNLARGLLWRRARCSHRDEDAELCASLGRWKEYPSWAWTGTIRPIEYGTDSDEEPAPNWRSGEAHFQSADAHRRWKLQKDFNGFPEANGYKFRPMMIFEIHDSLEVSARTARLSSQGMRTLLPWSTGPLNVHADSNIISMAALCADIYKEDPLPTKTRQVALSNGSFMTFNDDVGPEPNQEPSMLQMKICSGDVQVPGWIVLDDDCDFAKNAARRRSHTFVPLARGRCDSWGFYWKRVFYPFNTQIRCFAGILVHGRQGHCGTYKRVGFGVVIDILGEFQGVLRPRQLLIR